MNDGGLLCTAVLAPLSPSAALLSLLHPDVAQHHLFLTGESSPTSTERSPTQLPDVVSSVLGVVYDIMDDSDRVDGEEATLENALTCWARTISFPS